MPDPSTRYWQSLTELDGGPEQAASSSAPEPGTPVRAPNAVSRREFFRLMGLSAGAATLACRRGAPEKAVPFAVVPDESLPGSVAWYATTCRACAAGCGILAKVRDGRPIKIEGNERHPLTRGGVCAAGQASVLSVYDASRARQPVLHGEPTDWSAVDERVRSELPRIASSGGAIRLVIPVTPGPSAEAAIQRFLNAYPTARAVRWEANGARLAIAEAHRLTHGLYVLPAWRLERARVVVSLDSDFLGTFGSPVAQTRQDVDARRRQSDRLRHWQLEPILSLTGSNADERIAIAPSEVEPAALALLARVARLSGQPAAAAQAATASLAPALVAQLDAIAADLHRAGATGLVVSGSDEPRVQRIVNELNQLLGAYGSTLDLEHGVYVDPSSLGFGEFLDELRRGEVGAAILLGANPVYAHPDGEELRALLAGLELSVSTSDRLDETGAAVQVLAPDHHFLETWGDAEPERGLLGLQQPALRPLWDTRDACESLLRWAGEELTWREFLQARWAQEVHPAAATVEPFESFWDASLERGFVALPLGAGVCAGSPDMLPPRSRRTESPAASAAPPGKSAPGGELELALYQKTAIRDGALANNAWLQELPDPVTKAAWANYALVAPALAKELRLESGSAVTLEAAGRTMTLPLLAQPGMHPRVVAVAVGYGRSRAGSIGDGVGASAYPLGRVEGGLVHFARTGVRLRPAGRAPPIPLAQLEPSAHGRAPVRELGRDDPRPRQWSPVVRAQRRPGRRWAMAIDLDACTGCGACVVSCQAENNVPAVGIEELRRGRGMHWLRIDRYYSGPPAAPRVVHQPMLCQHCGRAPCESACPVLATVHSSEGLNQQVYPRCIGTRYCASACPVKARRFNWVEHAHDELERMVLNPDVVARSRGVAEKCSLCGHRIEEAKARAKLEGRELGEGEVRTACQQSCPASAIAFGDQNEAGSEVARWLSDRRAYVLLEELALDPAVHYLARLRKRGGTE